MRLAVVGLITLLTLAPSTAVAYKVYTTLTNGQRAPASCTLDQPRKLRWLAAEINYVIEPVPDQVLSSGDVTEAVIDSFQEWEAYNECGTPILKFNGAKSNLEVAYNETTPESNENALVWVTSLNDWKHSPGILALTTLTYSRCTGVIVDSDMEVNLAQFDFSAASTPPSHMTDVQNTITHEVGHFLGLDHSSESSATMFSNAPDAEIQKRDLEMDDISGLCCLYHPSSPIVVKTPEMVCEGAPPQNPEPDDTQENDTSAGCHAKKTDTGPGFSWALLIGAAFVYWKTNRLRSHNSR